MTDDENKRSLVPLPDASLALTRQEQGRVLSEMVGETLAFARRVPRLLKLSDTRIKWLSLNADGTYLVVRKYDDRLAAYETATGRHCASLDEVFSIVRWFGTVLLLEKAARIY